MASLIPIKPSVKGGLVLDASNKPVATPNLTVQAAAGAAGDAVGHRARDPLRRGR